MAWPEQVSFLLGNAVAQPSQQLYQRGLALLDRRPAHVLPVEFEQLERAQDHVVAVHCSRRRSNTAKPFASRTIASPSIRQDRTGSLATAAAAGQNEKHGTK